jgi:hypothetical protein
VQATAPYSRRVSAIPIAGRNCDRCRRDGDDRQLPIRLDVLRPRHPEEIRWDRASIQWAFTLFVLFETWLVPVEGWFVDKYGPRLVVLVGGILAPSDGRSTPRRPRSTAIISA